jgi:hypothetical protein
MFVLETAIPDPELLLALEPDELGAKMLLGFPTDLIALYVKTLCSGPRMLGIPYAPESQPGCVLIEFASANMLRDLAPIILQICRSRCWSPFQLNNNPGPPRGYSHSPWWPLFTAGWHTSVSEFPPESGFWNALSCSRFFWGSRLVPSGPKTKLG